MSQIEDLIIKTIEHYCGVNGLKLNTEENDTVFNFLNNLDIVLLQGYLQNNNELKLFTELQDVKKKCVIFYKTSKIHLNNDNFLQHINIITLSTTAAESLYVLLKQIFSPLFKNDTDLYSSKLQKNLCELESNLMVVTYGKSGNECIILSVEDELNYWQALSEKKNASQKEKEAATGFSKIFEDICEEMRLMKSSPMTETRELVENIGGLLDDLWRYNTLLYPQEKMIHILDVIGHSICSIIQEAFTSLNIWKVYDEVRNNEVLSDLAQSLRVMQTWNGACASLTEVYWPNYALHAWAGDGHVPQGCSNFQHRLQQVYDIRSIHNQLNKLLNKTERVELKTDALLEPYESVKIWICNENNEAWLAAKARFEMSLRPVETKVAEKLKPRLHNTSTKQMLYEFMRYKTLIERPQVKQALHSELEIFVGSLLAMLKSVQSQVDSEDVDVRMHQPSEMSPLVHQVQWAKQMEAKVKDIQMCAEKYLNEYEGSSEVTKLADKLLTDLKTMYTQLHQEWSRELQAQVNSGSASVSGEKPVVSFSGGQMVVQWEPRLARAQAEARCLAALGLSAPPAAALLDRLLDKLHHARALQQIASFHNTLGERMIPSTRPMMLEAAMELSSLVQNHKAVYWDDTQLLDHYTEQLKRVVVKLESQNSYLTSQHLAIRNVVEQLLDTELLAKQAEWKKKVKDIRDIIEKVELNGYKNTDVWKTHWDWQLYKALECQYIKTLLSLHKHFPPVRVDLVLRNHEVRLQPPMEEIQVQHYNQLRRLVSMPAQFVGVQTSIAGKSIFASIVDKHAWLGALGARRVGGALAAVESARGAWGRRAALACVPDVAALCAAHLARPDHWELNFKACKAYGQAVAKMTFEDEKIDWISVGTTSLRREFETQVRGLWAGLMSTLQASCHADAATLDAFVATAQLMLNDTSLPKNAKQLSEVSAKQQAVQAKMPEMEITVEDLKRKSHMLHTWGGDVTVDGTIKEWQKIKEQMTSHQQMFEHQAEIVKSSLSGEWENLKTSLETWMSRYSRGRARAESRGARYEEMVERCAAVEDARAQWARLVSDRDELRKECEKFDMKLDIDKTWTEAEQLINDDVKLWATLKDFDEEFSLIANQEWIVFQKKIYLLDEFTTKWKGQLEPYTAITLFLQQELDKYTDLTPLLKYVRGSDFSERHWREVFSLLDMEYKPAEALLVRDLLHVSSNIKKHIKALQQISVAATSESAVRSALNELEIWYAGARLHIVYYNDNAKRPVPIVKDYKDIIAKVEEQQWTVSSVSGAGEGAGAGGDACGAWAARLRAARGLLHAAHHAQRRADPLPYINLNRAVIS